MDTAATTTKVNVTTPSEREIRTGRVFDAPREMVWRAFTDPGLLKMWWARGNEMDIEEHDLRVGGHWRFVEHAPDGTSGFEGRFADVHEPYHIMQTFDWDGMPGHPSFEIATFEDLGDDRTRVVTTTLFYTQEERDGMMAGGMEQGMEQGYAALDKVLQGIG